MKKLISLFVIAFAIFSVTFAQGPDKMKTIELAEFADLIVAGEITDTKALNFELSVREVIRGENPGQIITVNRYKNLNQRKRWDKYRKGQQVLLFLQNDGSTWKILGKGGEGEMLILNDEVYMDSRGTGITGRISYYTVSGKKIYAEKLPYKDVAAVMKGFADLYELEYVERTPKNKDPFTELVARQVADDQTLYEYTQINELAEKLVTIANRHLEETGE